jgi:hypothetical protein
MNNCTCVRACELTCTAVQTNSVVLLGRRKVGPGFIHGGPLQASAAMIASYLTASTSTWRVRTRGRWVIASGTDYLFQVRSDANLINALADDHSKVTEEEEHVCLTIVADDDVTKRWLGFDQILASTVSKTTAQILSKLFRGSEQFLAVDSLVRGSPFQPSATPATAQRYVSGGASFKTQRRLTNLRYGRQIFFLHNK